MNCLDQVRKAGWLPLTWAALLWGMGTLFPASELIAEEAPPIPRLKTQVRVVDPDGKPVAGATVRPSGLRALLERASHYSWYPPVHGPLPTAETNEQGLADLVYPEFVVEKLKTGEVTWSVEHPDFVRFREDRKVVNNPAEVQLKHGFRIAATAIDGRTKEPIKTNLTALLAGSWSADWSLKANGILVSRAFDFEQQTLRLVHEPAEGPLMFSKMLKVNPGKAKERFFLKKVPLEPGVAVVGKLDASVPRPVKNGRVAALIVAGGAEESYRSRWQWADWAEVQADGTFRFDSMPPNGVVQIIAVSDGWISTRPSEQQVGTYFPDQVGRRGGSQRPPQLFELDGKDISPTIEMERAVRCEVTVLAPDGKPLPNAKVVMWPNQYWFRGGSQILGSTRRTMAYLRAHAEGKVAAATFQRGTFEAVSDENGLAVIANLPSGHSEGIHVSHDKFELPVSGNDRTVIVELTGADGLTRVTVKMQPKGTQVIGGEAAEK